jgi:VWFA-related protein
MLLFRTSIVGGRWRGHVRRAAALCFAMAMCPGSQAQDRSTPQLPVVRTGTTGVVLDVVVRDRRGHPVRDIQQTELTVLEDGVARDVRSFRLIERATPSGTAQPPPGSDQPDALRYPTLITFVFDHLSQNGRALAKRAAVQFVSRELAANQWVAIYGLEQRLRLAQAFTRDASELRSAIERATTVSAESQDHLTVERTDPEASERAASSAIAAAGSGGNPGLGAAISDVVVRDVLARMEHLVESSETQQRGQSTLFPLMALMKAQGSLAGRKALVFFSEGFAVPPNLEDAYRSAISEANRANVSIYAVDARGLDTNRALDQSRQMLDRSGRTSQAQLLFGGSQKPVTVDDIMSSERAEGALRTDTQNALRALAEETSGALIANTNDLGPGLVDRVRSDLDSYYEIGYLPGSGAADGRFRSVEVKIARRGISVHSRSGYFALPETDTTPLLPFELPMLAAAAATPPPQAFEFSSAAFRFDRSPKGVQHTVVVEVPLDHLTFEENRRARTYALRFTAMTLVKDQSGQIVQRSSETYPLEGPLDRLSALKRGRLRFKRQLWLPPGRYTLWTIARDQATERSSVKAVPLDVAEPSSGIRISDLSVIRTVDPAGAAEDAVEDPFRTGGMRVVPNLDMPISKASNVQISAYLTIYPQAGGGEPGLSFEFVRDGAVVGRSAAELPKPDESGRIKFVASFPTQIFTAGTYELRAVATQGARSVTSQTRFVLIP